MGNYLNGSRGIIWNQLQTISLCRNKACFSLKWKVKTLVENIVLIGWQTTTILHHEHLQAATFVKGLCSGAISLYLDVWRCITPCSSYKASNGVIFGMKLQKRLKYCWWLKYCRCGVKHYPINQSINQSHIYARTPDLGLRRCMLLNHWIFKSKYM